MYVRQCQPVIQAYQHGLNSFNKVVSRTDSLERLLRIVEKAIRIYSQIQDLYGKIVDAGIVKLSLQVKSGIEILGVVLSVNLMQELMCPDKDGLYFIRKASWQKCLGRIFLLFYSLLANIKLAAKFEWISIEKINKIAIGHLTIFKALTGVFYVLYYVSVVGEGVRVKHWFKVATSIGKIFVTISALSLAANDISTLNCVLTITSLSFTIDVFCIVRTLDFV